MSDQDAWKYTTTNAAFERVEKADSGGTYPSKNVLSVLLAQYEKYTPSEYLAPYSTIVGPSGIGKTFSVRQMAVRHGIYVAYSNLASPTSLVFPRPVTMGNTPVHNSYVPAETLWETYIGNQIRLAKCCQDVGITAAGLFELLTSGKEQVAPLRASLQAHFDTAPVDSNTMQTLLAPLKDSLEALGLNTLPLESTLPPVAGPLPVIICFDEARVLLDKDTNHAFRTLRKAAKAAATGGKEPPFFIVLLDTTSRITNFTPPSQYDHSAKFLQAKLYHPIYRIDTFGLFSPPAASLEDPVGSTKAVSQLFAHGRPLWGAYLEAGNAWSSVLRLAKAKIQAQTDRFAQDLSLLTYRMNFYIASPVLAEAMVAASMRYLISVSDDRTNYITTQPSEPVLALAASCLLQDPPSRLTCIRSWVRGLHTGAVNPGDIGEQVASLVLLFASDYAAEPSKSMPDIDSDTGDTGITTSAIPPRAISVVDFVGALLGPDAWQHLYSAQHSPSTREMLDNGLVFFNHMIRLSTAPTLAVMEAAYKRGAALFLPGNFPGMDVAIPVRVPTGRLALLLVQVKNRQNDSLTPGLRLYMEEALEKAEKALEKADKALSLSNVSGGLCGIVALVLCLRTSGPAHFDAVAPAGQPPRPRAKAGEGPAPRKRARTEEAAAGDKPTLLGVAYGLDASVYPCLRAPSAAAMQIVDGVETGPPEMEEMCALLAQLLEQWPDACAEGDLQTVFAQKLLDPLGARPGG